MTTFTFDQINAKQQSDPASASLTNGLVEDDILLIVGAERSGLDPPTGGVFAFTGVGTPTADVQDTNGTGSTVRCTIHLGTLQSPTPDTNKIVSFDDGTANNKSMLAISITPSATYNLTFQGSSVTGSGAAEVNGISSGSVGSISGGGNDLLVVDFAIARREVTAAFGTPAFTPTPDIFKWMDGDVESVGSNGVYICVGVRYAKADGNYSTTFSCDIGSKHEGIVGCAVYSNGALSAGGVATVQNTFINQAVKRAATYEGNDNG